MYSDVVLETENLILKKASFEDWIDIYENVWSRKECARYMFWDVTTSEEDAKARMLRTIEFEKKHKYALYVYEKASGRAIGFAAMEELEEHVFEEGGIALGSDYWNKGYGTEILNALVDEAKRLGGKRFKACCRTKNIGSHKVMMKCGFEFSRYEDCLDPRDGSAYVMEHNKKEL